MSGTIIKVRTRRASEAEPRYEIKSDKTAHVAAHRGKVLRYYRKSK